MSSRFAWGAALAKLNPGVPTEAIEQGIEQIVLDRSAMSLVATNRDTSELLENGRSCASRKTTGRRRHGYASSTGGARGRLQLGDFVHQPPILADICNQARTPVELCATPAEALLRRFHAPRVRDPRRGRPRFPMSDGMLQTARATFGLPINTSSYLV